MTNYFAGLDIGGTTVKSLLIDDAGQRIGEMVEVRSHVKEGYRATFAQLEESLQLLAQGANVTLADIKAVGLDVPAPCSKGVIWGQANMSPDWVGTNIQDRLSAQIHRPVTMTNDGNAAAYGEWLVRPERNEGLLFVAPGTGLGGGLVMPGGLMYEGANGLALEVSDATVPFDEDGVRPCDAKGREGSLEAWVSLIGIRRQLQAKLKETQYHDHPLNSPQLSIEERALQLRDYAEKKDPLARLIFQRQARVLGYGLGDFASLFDPGLFVIGGGLAETTFRDWYLDEVRLGFADRAAPFYQRSPLPPHTETTTFEWAIGGDSSAAFGAARRALTLFA